MTPPGEAELPTRTTPKDGTHEVCPTCHGDGHFIALDGNCPAKWAHRFLNKLSEDHWAKTVEEIARILGVPHSFSGEFAEGWNAADVIAALHRRMEVRGVRPEVRLQDTPKFKALSRLGEIDAMIRELRAELKGIHSEVLKHG